MPTQAASFVTSIVWRNGLRTDEHLDAPPAPGSEPVPGRLAWIDLCAPDAGQLKSLAALGVDAHALEDATAPGERPKAVRYDGYTFTTVYAVTLVAGALPRLRLDRISTLSLPGCLVTIRRDGAFDMGQVAQRWQDDPALVRFGVDGLLHGLLDVVVDQHFEVLQRLDDDIEGLVDVLFSDNPDVGAMQQKMFSMRRELVLLRRVVAPLRDVIATLIREVMLVMALVRALGDDTDTSLMSYYEDLNDHVLRASEWCDELRDLIASAFETNLALNDKRMNEAMKKLAAVAAIIAVPTLVTGWYGMNVPYPGFGTLAGIVSAAALVVLGVVGVYVLFRRKQWL
jgi:magnesium transporter